MPQCAYVQREHTVVFAKLCVCYQCIYSTGEIEVKVYYDFMCVKTYFLGFKFAVFLK